MKKGQALRINILNYYENYSQSTDSIEPQPYGHDDITHQPSPATIRIIINPIPPIRTRHRVQSLN